MDPDLANRIVEYLAKIDRRLAHIEQHLASQQSRRPGVTGLLKQSSRTLPNINRLPDKDRTIGDRVRRMRLRLGWSQARLGQAMGVSANRISWWECGRADVADHYLAALASTLNVSEGFLRHGLVATTPTEIQPRP